MKYNQDGQKNCENQFYDQKTEEINKPKELLEQFKERFDELLEEFDFDYNNFSKMSSEIRQNKTFQLQEKYNTFHLKTDNVPQLQIDIHRDSIESIEERYKTYFSDKTIEDKIKEIVNDRHLLNYKVIDNIQEIKKLTNKEVSSLKVQSYNGMLKFHLYYLYGIRSFISDLRILCTYLDYPIFNQDDIKVKEIENYEPSLIAKNLKLTLYKNHNIKISYIRKCKQDEKDILKEIYELFQKYDSSMYYIYR